MQKGIYQLLIYLSKSTRIIIGKRGTFRFPRGYYVYTGSAKNGLAARVKRHLRKEKKRFWHVDYLLCHASVRGAYLSPNEKADECSIAQRTLNSPEAKVIVPKFGASDCNCSAHLVFFKRLEEVYLDSLRELAIEKR
jgi:Uri superfamily endonuclease